jgi:hypothetical protein
VKALLSGEFPVQHNPQNKPEPASAASFVSLSFSGGIKPAIAAD